MQLLLVILACTGPGPDTAPVDTAASDSGGGDGGDGGDGGEAEADCDADGSARLSGSVDVADAWAQIRGAEDGGRAGQDVDVADLDGDGVDEVLVGARKVDAQRGAAYVISVVAGEQSVEASLLTLVGPDPKAELGSSLGGGDLDGDGVAELVSGASGTEGGGGGAVLFVSMDAPDEVGEVVGSAQSALGEVLAVLDLDGDGRHALYVGDRATLGGAAVVEMTGAGSTADAAVVWGSGTSVISAVSSAGDTNGDGFEELLVASDDFGGLGRVWVADASGGDLSDAIAIESDGNVGGVGTTIAALGDTDGDGHAELGVGSTSDCFVMAGPVTASVSVLDALGRIKGGAAAHGGSGLAGGDLDVDGRADVVCGAFNGDGDHQGEAYVFYGGVEGVVEAGDADAVIGGGGSVELVGYPLVVSADASGDGCPDVVLGAYGWSDYAGAAYVVRGGLE